MNPDTALELRIFVAPEFIHGTGALNQIGCNDTNRKLKIAIRRVVRPIIRKHELLCFNAIKLVCHA